MTSGKLHDDAQFFGFRRVDPAAKAGLVRDVFDRVASRYDLMNDLMSGGVHRLWKDRLIALARPRHGRLLVDLAAGTGDIAFRWLRATGDGGRALMLDINAEMLRHGRDRAIDRGLLGGLAIACGSAEALPLADRSVDTITIAFGLRNVTRIDLALAEAARVLRPGGRFLCLEFSRVPNPVLRAAYDAWSFTAIPAIGGLVARDRASYRYLVESIRKFPNQQALIERMQAAGLARCRYENLSGGIAAIHSGYRL